jgi:hypothetical protein
MVQWWVLVYSGRLRAGTSIQLVSHIRSTVDETPVYQNLLPKARKSLYGFALIIVVPWQL